MIATKTGSQSEESEESQHRKTNQETGRKYTEIKWKQKAHLSTKATDWDLIYSLEKWVLFSISVT